MSGQGVVVVGVVWGGADGVVGLWSLRVCGDRGPLLPSSSPGVAGCPWGGPWGVTGGVCGGTGCGVTTGGWVVGLRLRDGRTECEVFVELADEDDVDALAACAVCVTGPAASTFGGVAWLTTGVGCGAGAGVGVGVRVGGGAVGLTRAGRMRCTTCGALRRVTMRTTGTAAPV